MKTLPILFTLLMVIIPNDFLKAQNYNIDLLGQLEHSYWGDKETDIWGYVDSQANEYAILGTLNGTSIINVTNPANPLEVQWIEGPISGWKDIKVWDHYAYVTNESEQGLQIIDLSNLPNDVTVSYYTGENEGEAGYFTTAHNLFIDENGYCYVVGTDAPGRTLIFDLNQDPLEPPLVGTYDDKYVHDCFVRGDTLWACELGQGRVRVINVADKANPEIWGSVTTPGNYTHNCWLDDKGEYLYTTDEIFNGYLGAYDVQDIYDINETDKAQSSLSANAIPHNTFVHGDFLVSSYYKDGVTIHDKTNPNNIVEVGYYDTHPDSGEGKLGCWGVYPFLPSGIILASDMDGGLFVLAPNYEKACYLSGMITDETTGTPIANANIAIVGTGTNESSNLLGHFEMGIKEAGIYDLEISKPGYETKSVDVFLNNGVDLNLDFLELTPLPTIVNCPDPGAEEIIFYEDFESGVLEDWKIKSFDEDITWEVIEVGGNSPGNHAIYMNHYDYFGSQGEIDRLITPLIDITQNANPYLEIEYACAYNQYYNDILKIEITTNNGWTYTTLGEFSGAEFATVGLQSSNFIPFNENEWCTGSTYSSGCLSFDLSPFQNSSYVKLRFESTNDWGNNIFLDNITIKGDCANTASGTLNLKAYLQGAMEIGSTNNLMRDDLRAQGLLPLTDPYGEGETAEMNVFSATGPNAIVDWVLVQLHDPEATNNPVVTSRALLLQRDGDIVDVDGVSPPLFHNAPESFLVSINHRNHLSVITNPIYLVSFGASVDFTNISPFVIAYGEHPRAVVNNKYALWSSNANGDDKVVFQGPSNDSNSVFFKTMSDPGNTAANVNYILDGYHNEDLNMDGQVRYQGANNEINSIFFNVLTHPSSNSQLNYIIIEEMP